jgi:ribosomal protein S18 acetylase RimI-like enzyme
MTRTQLIEGASRTSDARVISAAVEWVIEAANPYLEWLVDGRDRATEAVAEMFMRADSELSLGQMRLLVVDGECVGGYIAMDGTTLARSRRADMMFLLGRAGAERDGLVSRIKESRDVFPAVRPEEWYLSKIGVDTGSRGRGFGRDLLESYLDVGAELGYSAFRLDVCEANERAVALYAGRGFETVRTAEIRPLGVTYLSMVLQAG